MYCLAKFCCVCLGVENNLQNVNNTDIDSVSILEKLIYLGYGHERIDLDTIKLICSNCLLNLRTAYNNKKTCLDNQNQIRVYTSQLKFNSGCVGSYKQLTVNLVDVKHTNNYIAQPPTETGVKFEPATNLSQMSEGEFLHKCENANHSVCFICHRSISDSYKMKLHMQNHIGGTFKCRDCPERFSKKKYLQVHMDSHHNTNQRPPKPTFTCNICQRSFNLSVQLIFHRKKHATRDSLCGKCGKQLPNKKQSLPNRLKTEIKRKLEETPGESSEVQPQLAEAISPDAEDTKIAIDIDYSSVKQKPEDFMETEPSVSEYSPHFLQYLSDQNNEDLPVKTEKVDDYLNTTLIYDNSPNKADERNGLPSTGSSQLMSNEPMGDDFSARHDSEII